MKKNKWFKTLEFADENYVLEANPDNKATNRKPLILSLVAACVCLFLTASSLFLFLPIYGNPPDASEYKNNDYYGIIEKLAVYNYKPPAYKNNFQRYGKMLTNALDFGLKGTAVEDAAPEMYGAPMNGVLVDDALTDGAFRGEDFVGSVPNDAPTSSGTGAAEGDSYQEVTDNQVAGITEADRIKRSDKHIYYLDTNTIRVFSIAGLDSKELGHFELLNAPNYYLEKWEFYLSQDCKTATVITQYTGEKKEVMVGIVSLDVSDPAAIKEIKRVELTGNYLSSRVTDGKLLLITEFIINRKSVNYDDPSTFVPHMDLGDGMSPIPADSIVCPETVSDSRYTVITQLDEGSLEIAGSTGYLSYSKDVYVSENHIFLTHVFADITENENGKSVRNAMTEISCLTYKDSFAQSGSVTVRGYVKDRWSMDEYENILRVVTTTNATTISQSYSSDGLSVSASVLSTATGNSNASLYCVDLSNFQVVASVIDFAPPREEVQSVRFDKDTAYVCTSIEMSDPVFFFDLSDLNNITYKDTGTIEGFSTSLVNFGNGYLLGIGREDWGTFKAEIYEETETGVAGICSYTVKADYSTDYKSYYIDRENQLLGLGIVDLRGMIKGDEDSAHERYILLHFDGYNLIELVNTPLQGNNLYKRGVYIDGYMYMFGHNDFRVEKVF